MIDQEKLRQDALYVMDNHNGSMAGRLIRKIKRHRERLIWAWETAGCECHWHEPYGPVIMAGCPYHD